MDCLTQIRADRFELLVAKRSVIKTFHLISAETILRHKCEVVCKFTL